MTRHQKHRLIILLISLLLLGCEMGREASAFLPAKCSQPDINAPQEYGGKGCKLITPSPDEKYIAFVAITRQGNGGGVYFIDSVKVLDINQSRKEKEIYVAYKMDVITKLEWTLTGQLIFWERIWEGPWVVFIYDPVKDSILSETRAGEDALLQWNPQHTAFYTTHTGEYGAGRCVGELGGYDFQSNKPLPDLYKVFNMEEQKDDPFGIPYGKSDNLYIEPFGWSQDGKKLWLTVTPLYWKGDQAYEYEVGPRQAGALEFSTIGVTYTPLASNPSLNYSFESLPNPIIEFTAYQPRLCP